MSSLSQTFQFYQIDNSFSNTATNAVVYPNSETTWLTFVSDPLKGNGYYGADNGIHTVMYVMSNDFVGTVTMQATLATMPSDGDWFDVVDTTSSYTELTNNAYQSVTTNMVDTYNFSGNFVYVRSVVGIYAGSVFYVNYNN